MKTNLFAFLTLIIVLISCTENDNTITSESINLFDFKPLNLKKHEIPATIYLPDETFNIGASTEVEVNHEVGDFKWEIAVGPNFKFKIDDWGDDKQILQAEKDKLKTLDFYKITYIKNSDNKIIYKRELKLDENSKAPKKVGKEHVTYHIFQMKDLDGIIYVLKNNDEGSSKKIVDLLEKSFETFKSNNKNS